MHHHDPLAAINAGMRASARVVTAAGLIMISVFGGFVFGDDIIIKSIGLALAFGVLVDAFLVRMTLVPATLALLRRSSADTPGRCLPGSTGSFQTSTSKEPNCSPKRLTSLAHAPKKPAYPAGTLNR